MGHLLRSLTLSALALSPLVLLMVYVVAFLYQRLRFLRVQNLGAQHFGAKRYAEAAEAFQTVLRRRPPAGIEADTRRRLADTLDVLGRTEEAHAERDRAGATALRGGFDPMAMLAQGDLLERQGRHDEAGAYFEQALKRLPAMPGGGRATAMAKLALSHHHAGRSDQTLRYARAALANRPDKIVRLVMHKMAGVALSDMGDLEGADAEYKQVLAQAEAANNTKEAAGALALLAGLEQKRGRYDEAIAAARRARTLADDPVRIGTSTEAECYRDLGRFEEARAVMRDFLEGPRHDEPYVERKMQALGQLGLGWIEARAERPEAAWEHLEAAREGLKVVTSATTWPPAPGHSEDKVVVRVDATAANVLAQLGRVDDSRRLRGNVESALGRFASDRATLMGAYGQLGRAALRAGDLADSRRLWEAYLACQPSPSGLPGVYLGLGETLLRLGDTAGARQAFENALAPGIDNLDARRAQAQLNAL